VFPKQLQIAVLQNPYLELLFFFDLKEALETSNVSLAFAKISKKTLTANKSLVLNLN
jgi:hypothetical protein